MVEQGRLAHVRAANDGDEAAVEVFCFSHLGILL
jgi:hypothetical protein